MNELKDNKRIIEIRAAYALNRIYNYINRKNFKEHMILLEALVESVDEENREPFINIVKNSVAENILGASKKEIYATMKVFSNDKTTGIADRLGISRSSLYRDYVDLTKRKFIIKEFI